MSLRLMILPILLAASCSSGQSEPSNPTQNNDQSSPTSQTGEELFSAHCASCHGQTAQGDGPAAKGLMPPPANLLERRQGPHPSGKNRWEIILTGSKGTAMPAFAEILKPSQLEELHGYLRQLMHGGTGGGECGGSCGGGGCGPGAHGAGAGHNMH